MLQVTIRYVLVLENIVFNAVAHAENHIVEQVAYTVLQPFKSLGLNTKMATRMTIDVHEILSISITFLSVYG